MIKGAIDELLFFDRALSIDEIDCLSNPDAYLNPDSIVPLY